MSNLELPSTNESIITVQHFVENVIEKHTNFSHIFANIMTALCETVNNAIVHGNRHDPKKLVRIDYTVDDEIMEFTVRDEGQGFDPTNIPDPTLPENIEKPEGRGIYLIRHLTDSVEFEDEGRTVIIRFSSKMC